MDSHSIHPTVHTSIATRIIPHICELRKPSKSRYDQMVLARVEVLRLAILSIGDIGIHSTLAAEKILCIVNPKEFVTHAFRAVRSIVAVLYLVFPLLFRPEWADRIYRKLHITTIPTKIYPWIEILYSSLALAAAAYLFHSRPPLLTIPHQPACIPRHSPFSLAGELAAVSVITAASFCCGRKCQVEPRGMTAEQSAKRKRFLEETERMCQLVANDSYWRVDHNKASYLMR